MHFLIGVLAGRQAPYRKPERVRLPRGMQCPTFDTLDWVMAVTDGED
jgi:hypothetical protein